MSDRKIPFGVTLTCCTALCAFFWVMTFLFPIYVGAAALIIGTACLSIQLAVLVRRAFTFGSCSAVAFVNGDERAKPAVANGPDGRFYNPKKAAMTAQIAAENEARALRRDLEAK